MAERLDDYDMMPRGMREYLSYHGRHFSKPMYEWAVDMMETRDGGKVKSITKEAFDEKMKSLGVSVKNDMGYDLFGSRISGTGESYSFSLSTRLIWSE